MEKGTIRINQPVHPPFLSLFFFNHFSLSFAILDLLSFQWSKQTSSLTSNLPKRSPKSADFNQPTQPTARNSKARTSRRFHRAKLFFFFFSSSLFLNITISLSLFDHPFFSVSFPVILGDRFFISISNFFIRFFNFPFRMESLHRRIRSLNARIPRIPIPFPSSPSRFNEVRDRRQLDSANARSPPSPIPFPPRFKEVRD